MVFSVESIDRLDPGLIAFAFAVGMSSAILLGWWKGRRRPTEAGDAPEATFITPGTQLLVLLLAFTFSISLSRYDQRRTAVVAESGAVREFYAWGKLLGEPERSRLADLLRTYANEQRGILGNERTEGEEERESGLRSLRRQAELIDIVRSARSKEGPGSTDFLLSAANSVASTNAHRVAVFRTRLPGSIIMLLFLSAVVPSFLLGRNQGRANQRSVYGSAGFIAVVALVIYVTLDLNQPRRGTIQVELAPLDRVMESMTK